MPTSSREAILIVGAGPIGLSCAISATRRGLQPLVIDAGAIAESIVRYPIGMTFFTTPERLEIGGHPLVCAGAKATREEALKYYRGVVRTEKLRVQTGAKLLKAVPSPHGLECTIAGRLGVDTMIAERVVLATGYFDHPNALGVPGEQLPHVSHYFDEAHRSAGLDVVVIGGKNSAVETALQLVRAGARVTLVYRGASLPPGVKYWLKPDLENRIKAGEIAARFGADVVEITDRDVVLGGGVRLPAERVYALTGYHPDFDLFSRIGIEFDAATGRPKLNPGTLETTVPGVYLAGSVTAGRKISEVFIENGRFDGEKIFGDAGARAGADERYAKVNRPIGE